MVADLLASRVGTGFRRDRSRVQAASGRLAGLPVTIAKPMSFMNLAGSPLAAVAGFYKIPPDRIVAVHDELDLPFGTIRLKLARADRGAPPRPPVNLCATVRTSPFLTQKAAA